MAKLPVCCIYRIVCEPTGKCYVGSTKDCRRRWALHRSDLRLGKHHSLLLQRAWNKYGPAAFTFEVVEEVATQDELEQREAHWIATLRPQYNRSLTVHSHSRGMTFGPLSAERRAKIRAANTGKRHSDEAWASMRGRRTGVQMTAAQLANLRRGMPNSADTRRKISEKQLGRKQSAETCARRSAALKGKPWSEARRAAQYRAGDDALEALR